MPKFSLALLLCAAGAYAAGNPWTPQDLWNRHTPSDPRISPDGQQVIYVDSWNVRDSNASCSNLWLVSTRDPHPRRLTDGPWRDQVPRWSPDSSRVAWISGRGGIHVLTLRDGQEISIETAALSLAWSADGQSIAFTANSSGHAAILVVPAAGGTPQPVSSADFDASGEPSWMPDGKSILSAASDGEIYSIRLADRTARRLIQEPGRKERPLPSPNGTKIAWMVTDYQPHSYSIRKLYVMNADGSRVKLLAGALDRDPSDPHWSSDSRTLYFTADDSGSSHVFASRADSTLRQVTKSAERLRGFSLADNGHAVTVRATEHAEEIVTFAVDLPPVPVVLMTVPMPERDMAAVEEVQVPSGGRNVQGWLVKPPDFDSSRKHPLLLEIADSPRRMYGPEFDLRAQIFAAHGWLVLHVNPRGTPGYGEQFGRLLPTRYPGDDADDLLTAVDYVIAKGYVDPQHVVVSGGLVAAWMIGHTDRFSAAVVQNVIVDFTQYALVHPIEILSWMGVMPWEDPEQYVRHSPIYFAQSWKTPTLVIAGAVDPQSDELYAALQQRKVKSELLRVSEGERPAVQIQVLDAILGWIQ